MIFYRVSSYLILIFANRKGNASMENVKNFSFLFAYSFKRTTPQLGLKLAERHRGAILVNLNDQSDH